MARSGCAATKCLRRRKAASAIGKSSICQRKKCSRKVVIISNLADRCAPGGIREIVLRPAQLSKTPERPVTGSSVKSGRTTNFIRHWRFDEGAGGATTEAQSSKACDVGGAGAAADRSESTIRVFRGWSFGGRLEAAMEARYMSKVNPTNLG